MTETTETIEVLKKIKENGFWNLVPRPAVAEYSSIYAQLPTLLADRLGNLVSLEEILICRLIWIRSLIQFSFTQNVVLALSLSDNKNMRRNKAGAIVLEKELKEFERTLAVFEDGQTKFVSRSSPKVTLALWGLEGDALKAYDNKNLTIRDVLISNPQVIAPLWLVLF